MTSPDPRFVAASIERTADGGMSIRLFSRRPSLLTRLLRKIRPRREPDKTSASRIAADVRAAMRKAYRGPPGRMD